jgi:1-acyl-sn-glycerol-3-phosphate acyltransferase
MASLPGNAKPQGPGRRRVRIGWGRSHWNQPILVPQPGQVAPWFSAFVSYLLGPLVGLCHRPTLEGIPNLPQDQPYLLVANHSAGMGMAELASFTVMYLKRVGPHRPLAGFVLPMDFQVFPFSLVARGIGAIPSTYPAAFETLAAGVPILLFPGGDHESLKPLWQAHRVDFGGRLGFLRLAREAGVPVVPMGIRGAHFTAPILCRSRLLANLLVFPRFFGIKRWGISVLGAIGAALIAVLLPGPWYLRAALIWLWLGSPVTFLAWIPWTIRMRIGKPIPAADLFGPPGATPTEEQLAQALQRVQAAVQALVD